MRSNGELSLLRMRPRAGDESCLLFCNIVVVVIGSSSFLSMYKLVLFLSIITLCSCREEGMLEVDLTKDSNTFDLKPEGALTSGCELHFIGHLTCDVEMKISGGKGINFTKGSVDVTNRYEWYSGGRTVTVRNINCSGNDSLRIYYTYSTGYFGQPKG